MREGVTFLHPTFRSESIPIDCEEGLFLIQLLKALSMTAAQSFVGVILNIKIRKYGQIVNEKENRNRLWLTTVF